MTALLDDEVRAERANRPAPLSGWLPVVAMREEWKELSVEFNQLGQRVETLLAQGSAETDPSVQFSRQAMDTANQKIQSLLVRMERTIAKAFKDWGAADVTVDTNEEGVLVTLYWDWPQQWRQIEFKYDDPLTSKETDEPT